MYLINLIKGGFRSPPHEMFNLDDVPGGSQEGGNIPVEPDLSPPATPSRRQRRKEKQAQKAGSRQGKLADDTQAFFQVDGDKKRCRFCLCVFLFIYLHFF